VNRDVVVSLTSHALQVALEVAAPILVAGLVVGLIVSVFQAVTQIQEQSLQFIPKLIATGAVLVLAGPWMLDQLIAYAAALWLSIPELSGP
jgi:flagellar biosynthesis protein FliQ